VVEVALDAGRPPGRRRDVRLDAEPGGEPVGGDLVISGGRGAVATQRGGEAGSGTGDLGQPLLQQTPTARVSADSTSLLSLAPSVLTKVWSLSFVDSQRIISSRKSTMQS
jgi:hypothetical protein